MENKKQGQLSPIENIFKKVLDMLEDSNFHPSLVDLTNDEFYSEEEKRNLPEHLKDDWENHVEWTNDYKDNGYFLVLSEEYDQSESGEDFNDPNDFNSIKLTKEEYECLIRIYNEEK